MQFKLDNYETMDIDMVEMENVYGIIYKSKNTRFCCDACNTISLQSCRCKDYDYTYNFYSSFCFSIGTKTEMLSLFETMVEKKDILISMNRAQLSEWLINTFPGYEIHYEW